MGIKIENLVTNKVYAYYVNRMIRGLIKSIPKEHLIGLDKIMVVDAFNRKNEKNAGLYLTKRSWKEASIEISLLAVYENKPFEMFIPFVGKFIFAGVLYHEIGHHHHHRLKHGISKQNREEFAESYTDRQIVRAFWKWIRFFRIFVPLIKLIIKLIKAIKNIKKRELKEDAG